MPAISNLEKSKQISKINVSLMTVLLALVVSVFTGCGGDSAGSNINNPPPPQQTYYSVSFITNGGTYLVPLNDVTSIPTEPKTTRAGYDFDGWFTASNFSGNRITFPYTVTRNTTLYAKWTQVAGTYTVTFETNGGSYLAPLTNVTSIPTEPHTTRAGYDFDGWFTASSFSGGRITFPYTVTRNTTLYAKWTAATTWIDIWTPAQLNDVRNNLAGKYRLMADISLSSYSNWVSIGTESNPFTGTIDGNGYKITELTIREEYFGLFGLVSGGTITNLALENVDIDGGAFVGAVAGYLMNNSIITNCYSTGIISSHGDYYIGFGSSYSITGGIAGVVENSTIADCYSTGDISSSYSSTYYIGAISAGGIAGLVIDNSIIINSYSKGNITSSDYYSDYTPAGGIAGRVENSTITNCYSEGDISASSYVVGYNDSYAGGIAGTLDDSTITNCYSKGDIAASSPNYSGSSHAGGIAGDVGSSTITNCYSYGDIIASSYSGGIAGTLYDSTITNCAAINKIVKAEDYAGRIIGNTYVTALISNNFALNTMSATGSAQFDTADTKLHGVSKTDAQLRQQSTYSDAIIGDGLGGLGWKFGSNETNPWKMPSGGGYPILYWQ